MHGLERSARSCRRQERTNHDKIVGIGPFESRNANAGRKSFLGFELHVQALPKVGLNAHSLEDENAHSNHALLGWVRFVFYGVKYAEDNEIMRPLRINDKRPEPFVALQGFPKEHQHLRRPFDGFLATREVRVCRLHLPISCEHHDPKSSRRRPTGWFRILVMPSTRNWKSCGR